MTFFGVFRIFEACFVSPFLQHFFPAPWLRGKESVPQLPALPGHPDPPGRHQHPGHGNGGRVLTPRTRPYSEVRQSSSPTPTGSPPLSVFHIAVVLPPFPDVAFSSGPFSRMVATVFLSGLHSPPLFSTSLGPAAMPHLHFQGGQ